MFKFLLSFLLCESGGGIKKIAGEIPAFFLCFLQRRRTFSVKLK